MRTSTLFFTICMQLINTASFSQAGLLDSTFSADGKVTTDFGGNDYGYSVAIQAEGRIVVAGSGTSGLELARYQPNGAIDGSFGTNGKVLTDSGSAYSVAIQADGKIVVAGYASNSPSRDFLLVRYRGNGQLDSAFGVNGKATTDFGGDDYGASVAIQSDGKIIVAGSSAATYTKFALARYNKNGTLDNTFGKKGKVTTKIALLKSESRSVVIQADGKIVVAGYASFASGGFNGYFATARYKLNGGLDSAFGVNGIVTTNVSGHGENDCRAVAIQSDGKIVVSGLNRYVRYPQHRFRHGSIQVEWKNR